VPILLHISTWDFNHDPYL